MHITQVNHTYGWVNNQLKVTEFRKEIYDKGNNVHLTIERTYNVNLYDSKGKEHIYKSAGNNVDVMI